MTSPMVSVVMSVHNGAPVVQEAIASILSQSFTDFEFIIIDDGSTDETPDILAHYDDCRIVILRNPTNIGLTKSLNRGLKAAKGEYIARQDADDTSLPDRLAKQVSFLQRHDAIALVATWYWTIDEHRGQKHLVQVPTDSTELSDCLIYEDPICHGSVMFRGALAEGLGYYEEGLRYAQDWDLWLRLTEHFQFGVIPEPLYVFNRSQNAISNTAYRQQQFCVIKAVEAALERREASQQLRLASPKFVARAYLTLAFNYLIKEDVHAAKLNLAQAIKYEDMLCLDLEYIVRRLVYIAVAVSRSSAEQLRDTEGHRYIDAFFGSIPGSVKRHDRNRVWGWFYAALAFEHHWQGNWGNVVRASIWAVCHDCSWLFNLGLMRMTLKAACKRLICH